MRSRLIGRRHRHRAKPGFYDPSPRPEIRPGSTKLQSVLGYRKMTLDAVAKGKESIVDIQVYVRNQPLMFRFDEHVVLRTLKHLVATGHLVKTSQGRYRIHYNTGSPGGKKPAKKTQKKKTAVKKIPAKKVGIKASKKVSSSMAGAFADSSGGASTSVALSLPSSAGSSSQLAAPSAPSGLIQHPDVVKQFAGLPVVYDNYMECVDAAKNTDKFYHVQVIQKAGQFYSISHWGRRGKKGQVKIQKEISLEKATITCNTVLKKKVKDGAYKLLKRGESTAIGSMDAITLQDTWKWRSGSGTKFLDASVLFFGFNGEYLQEYVDYRRTSAFPGRIATHSGDVMTPDSGKHVVNVNLSKLPAAVGNVFIVLSCYQSATLYDILAPVVCVEDTSTGNALCGYQLDDAASNLKQTKCVIMCRIHRASPGAEWKVDALGELLSAGTVNDYSPITAACTRACSA